MRILRASLTGMRVYEGTRVIDGVERLGMIESRDQRMEMGYPELVYVEESL